MIASKTLKSIRFATRGQNLEVDRTDGNIYSRKKCVLACYFCNNDKSDVVSSKDYLKYFRKTRAKYLADKIKLMKSQEIVVMVI